MFNRKSLDDIYEGLKEVWASPLEFRSFSWRQTLIDDPIWVLSSVVILESVPNDKSGVLVTADVNTGDMAKMTVAVSEGVGGAVDGTSAETLLWSSPQGIELVTLFKSPWKNQLLPGGGSAIVPSTGKDTVLEPDELKQIIAAGQKISATFEPAHNPAGKARPWDIEFGFKAGKLWLFQCRPFLGNDALNNIPALASLEGQRASTAEKKTAVLRGDSPMNVSRAGRLTRSPLLPLAVILLAVGIALLPWPAFAALDASDTTWDGSEPPQGIYFHWYEPSFYTGFAPRTQDPQRVHIRLSRGNQVRVTVVLGDKELDVYLDDLVLRRKTYQELIDAKVIELSTNKEYERFVEKLDQAGVADVVKRRDSLGPAAYRQKSLDIMSVLNPRACLSNQDTRGRPARALAGATCRHERRRHGFPAEAARRCQRDPSRACEPVSTEPGAGVVPHPSS